MKHATLIWGLVALIQATATLGAGDKYRICVVEVPKVKKYSKFCSVLDTAVESKATCVKARTRIECLMKVSDGNADFTVLESEDIVVASNTNNNIFITNNIRFGEEDPYAYQVVAIVRNIAGINKLTDLHDSALCHPGYGGNDPQWTELISRFFEARVVPQLCNESMTLTENRIRSTSAYFKSACKAGTWVPDLELDAQLKSKYPNLCALCDSPASCSTQDKYWGRQGALFCLTDGLGDVAWGRLNDVQTHFKLGKSGSTAFGDPSEYSFLCDNGSVQPLTTEKPCAWLARPWPAVVAAKSTASAVQHFVSNLTVNTPVQTWQFALDRLMTDTTSQTIVALPSLLMPEDYLKSASGFMSANSLSDCTPGDPLSICTSTNLEFVKCSWMAEVAKAYGIDPTISCVQAKSVPDCMNVVQGNAANVVIVKPDFELSAIRDYHLKPLIYEYSNNIGSLYNAAIVVKANSQIKRFEDLKGHKACFPRYEGIGWTSAIKHMRSKSLISNSCPYSKSVGDFFAASCVPGLDKTSKDYQESLRALCKDDPADHLLVQNDAEKYSGDQGAFRCLASGVGHVAFIDLATIANNTDGQNSDSWAVGLRSADFRSICVGNATDRCHLRREFPGQVMMKKDVSRQRQMEMYITFLNLDDLFGKHKKNHLPVFELFGPFNDMKNVMFQDATQRLEGPNGVAVNAPEIRTYEDKIKNLSKCAASTALVSSTALLAWAALFFV